MTRAPGIAISGRATIEDVTVFDGLDLHVLGGRWTCLLGPSGVGKSSILRLLAGTADHVHFDGKLSALHGQVALMSQDGGLLPWLDAVANVTLGARLRGVPKDEEGARDLLARVGLAGFEARKPHELSGGQRQRVALARTLMENRPVVLLDEPFSALDARTRTQVQDLAVEVLTDRTVLHVTHDPGEAARLGHQIVLMNETGSTQVASPETSPPRAVDDPATLACQAQLLRLLMAPT